MHVLPQLRELEKRFGDELVIIGVHAGKFRAERITANIAQAAARMGVHHAIVNDRQYRIWRAFGVQAWPTVVLVDPDGGYVGALPGEFTADQLEPRLRSLLARDGGSSTRAGAESGAGRAAAATAAGEPVGSALTTLAESAGTLCFPGKLITAPGGRLFLSDSGHDRILELQVAFDSSASASAADRIGERPQAQIRQIIGSGACGAADGPLATASFDHPQGLALRSTPERETLFVADSENHTIRAVDLRAGEVTTLVGTGEQARRANEPGSGRSVALSSPWDLVVFDRSLVIAMAGAHQLWRLDFVTLRAEPWVGSGREDLSDGPAFRCALAQPMGLCLDRDRLFFADAESSAVRFVDWRRSTPEVTTIVGRGLFEFGDEDGKGGHVRLQHPYAVVAVGDDLYVADTYNNKIKQLDLSGRCATFAGSGEEGLVDGPLAAARFDEPQGLAVDDDVLYVADTNNHAIRVIDLRAAAGGNAQVLTLEIIG